METQTEVMAIAACTTEAAQPKQWEAFPQPAGWSAKWDFEELDKAPRLNGRSEAIAAQIDEADAASDEA
jgi:hypothetical protein